MSGLHWRRAHCPMAVAPSRATVPSIHLAYETQLTMRRYTLCGSPSNVLHFSTFCHLLPHLSLVGVRRGGVRACFLLSRCEFQNERGLLNDNFEKSPFPVPSPPVPPTYEPSNPLPGLSTASGVVVAAESPPARTCDGGRGLNHHLSKSKTKHAVHDWHDLGQSSHSCNSWGPRTY